MSLGPSLGGGAGRALDFAFEKIYELQFIYMIQNI